MFTFDSASMNIYFHDDANYVLYSRNEALKSLPWLWQMNYDAGEYLNNSVDPFCDVLDAASIVTIASHGDNGIIAFPDPHTQYAPRMTWLTTRTESDDITDYKRAVTELGDLSNIKLLMLNCCNSALDDEWEYSLDEAFNDRGVNCVIGWKNTIPAFDTYGQFELNDPDYSAIWVEYFFQACYFNHCTIEQASETAYARMKFEGYDEKRFKSLINPAITNRGYILYPS